jgi:hypothetical protein
MASAQELEAAVSAAVEAITKQGDTVRSLKAQLKEGKIEKVCVLRVLGGRAPCDGQPPTPSPHPVMRYRAPWTLRLRR